MQAWDCVLLQKISHGLIKDSRRRRNGILRIEGNDDEIRNAKLYHIL